MGPRLTIQSRDWLLVLMFAALVAYGARFERTYARIAEGRSAVGERVGWISRLTALEETPDAAELRRLSEEARGGTPAPQAADTTAATILAVAAQNVEAGEAAAAIRQIRAAMAVIRGANGATSIQLGTLVDDTRYAAVGGLVFGAACIAALVLALRGLTTVEKWQRRMNLLTQATSDGLWEWDVSGGNVRYSPAWREMTGATGSTLQDWFERVHPEELTGLRRALDEHLAGTTPTFEAEYRLRDAQGRWRWILARGLAERRGSGPATHMACWQTDITDRRIAAERGALLHHVTDATGLAVLAIDESGVLIQHNQAAEALSAAWGGPDAFWAALSERAGSPATSRCADCGEPQPEGAEVVTAAGNAGGPRELQLTWSGHAHGLVRDRRVTVVTVADVTVQNHAEAGARAAHERVLASEAELRGALDAVPEVVVVTAADRILYRNAAADNTFAGPLGSAEWLAALRLVAGTGESTMIAAADGSLTTFEVGAPVPITFLGEQAELLVAHDVSQRVRMESKLRTAERMVALGGLAAGLAHEINNPLTYVIGNLELAQDGVGDVAGRVSRALGGAVRVRQVVAQLRAVASPEAASELVCVPVAPAVESTLSLASGIGLPPATVVREMEPGVTVLGNPVWLGQITLNLVSNALLAMAPLSAEARRLTLRTRTSGELVLIECSDSGGGVSETIRDRLFEPFVSTRLQGSGSGLGLYVCRELAGRMGGSLELTQTGPAGTTFTLRLPRFVSIGADVPAPPPVRPSPRRGRVLVVDDEPLIGEVARSHLREHDVHVVATNESALAAFVQHDWDVVVLDIVLAGGAGGDLWTKIQTLAPSAAERVVFVSGGSMTPDVARFLVETHHPTLVKPFDFRELAQLVNDHVARRGAQFA